MNNPGLAFKARIIAQRLDQTFRPRRYRREFQEDHQPPAIASAAAVPKLSIFSSLRRIPTQTLPGTFEGRDSKLRSPLEGARAFDEAMAICRNTPDDIAAGSADKLRELPACCRAGRIRRRRDRQQLGARQPAVRHGANGLAVDGAGSRFAKRVWCAADIRLQRRRGRKGRARNSSTMSAIRSSRLQEGPTSRASCVSRDRFA